MSGFSVEWDIVQEIVQSLNPNKALGLDHIPQEILSYVSPLLYKGSLKFV